jgi:hypothetical protein
MSYLSEVGVCGISEVRMLGCRPDSTYGNNEARWEPDHYMSWLNSTSFDASAPGPNPGCGIYDPQTDAYGGEIIHDYLKLDPTTTKLPATAASPTPVLQIDRSRTELNTPIHVYFVGSIGYSRVPTTTNHLQGIIARCHSAMTLMKDASLSSVSTSALAVVQVPRASVVSSSSAGPNGAITKLIDLSPLVDLATSSSVWEKFDCIQTLYLNCPTGGTTCTKENPFSENGSV